MGTSNLDIYNKLIGIENRLTKLEECIHHKNKAVEFWEKILSGAIGAAIIMGMTSIKKWLGWE